MISAGVAVIDITPEPGLGMAGFAARTEGATGTHDPLTVRALVVGDTAVVGVDVVGLHEDLSRRVRERAPLPAANIVIAAIHTHGAPVSMLDRLGAGADPAFLQRIEDACVAAITQAMEHARPAKLSAGMGPDPDVARNRRHVDGPLDRSVPVLKVTDVDGRPISVLISYACHPVVLGADNRLMTADYPYYVRRKVEAEHPGAVCVFLTGCTGDANTGHSAHASWTLAADDARTFKAAEHLGTRIAESALAAPLFPVGETVVALEIEVNLSLTRLEQEPLPALARAWQDEAQTADPVRRIVLGNWIGWADKFADTPPGQWNARVSALDWGGVPIVALPGEIFSETGLSIRIAIGERPGFIISYAEGLPGYIPPASEFQYGGYEVEEAHRFFGMPGTFAPGSAEALASAARRLLAVIENPPYKRFAEKIGGSAESMA